MTGAPAISVVIPAHNAGRYLDTCLASVVTQDFREFEIVIYDDGSTDETAQIIRRWAERDPRIRSECGAARLGPVGSSNRATELARAPLVARIDADDVMLPGRLDRQAALFAEQPDAVLCGTLAWTIDGQGHRVREPDLARLLRPSRFAPFAHSSVMFRKQAWLDIGGYRAEAAKWEDVDLFLRMAGAGGVWTLPVPLMEYRQNPDSTRLAEGLESLEAAMDAMVRQIAGYESAGGIAPAAYRHIGATLLWSGGRPALFARVLRHAALRTDGESLALICWTLLAQTVPGLLRQLLRVRLAWQNRCAAQLLGRERAVEWVPAG